MQQGFLILLARSPAALIARQANELRARPAATLQGLTKISRFELKSRYA
jgi:hypothetical protein